MCMAEWLSQNKVTGLIESTCNSCNNLTNQVISVAACAMTLYSASDELRDTTAYFLDFHEMGEESSRIKYPVTDLLDIGQAA